MNLQQLRYVHAVVKNQFNLTTAARVLHTSQPGISRQIRELEDELGVEIFVRRGKRLLGLTGPGEAVAETVARLLTESENLKRVGAEYAGESVGRLTIAATHMQARYFLPKAVSTFRKRYPGVELRIQQGSPRQLAESVIAGEADLAVATETLDRYDALVALPCYAWHHSVVVPTGHPLIKAKPLTLRAIAKYPIITYDAAFTGRTALDQSFAEHHLSPTVVLTAIDTDVIKTYVALGLGIGIIAAQGFDKKRDEGLVALDAGKLFPHRTTKVAYRKGAYLRGYVREFIALLAPEAAEQSGLLHTGKRRAYV